MPFSSSSSSIDSSSSSSIDFSSSTSSGDFPVLGTTYYSEFKDINSINNPIIDNGVKMKYSGFFDIGWDEDTLNIDGFGYGLKKTINNQGSVFCEDASKLFSMGEGYLGIILSFPYGIRNGIYEPLRNDTNDLNEYILWGVNVGQYETSQPSLYAALTPRGIEFTIQTSKGFHTIRDEFANVAANTDIFLEFAWNMNEIDNYLIRTLMRIDGVNVAAGNPPIADDDISNLNFYVLNTPFGYNNMECIIRKLIIDNVVPKDIEDELYSSSSESSSSSS